MSLPVNCRTLLKLIPRRQLGVRLYSLATTKFPTPVLTSTTPLVSSAISRFKSKGSKQKQKESEDEEETEEEIEDFDNLIVDKQTKVTTLRVSSLRADVVLKSCLHISRSKVDEAFYESKIRINGKKLLKKSDPVQEGDEIDIVREIDTNNPNFLNVARVEVLQIAPKSQSFSLRARRCKSLLIENYEDKWTPAS
ncbi:hypothetical protein PPYR_12375 [Photinus pyralis]|uniref:Mitochondrial transcription rescue factor 1 C-terminal domain-containing protein n=1 Tax=Photinus pyralis TaxID=7054 RepID=A0A1Y1KP78_PHOPY|nr:mitochondrial transcription rescue factor 1 [Photinus pyralis]KAB0795536.1 hypothetical protein PPYR_12375 [Photinus pyralis]